MSKISTLVCLFSILTSFSAYAAAAIECSKLFRPADQHGVISTKEIGDFEGQVRELRAKHASAESNDTLNSALGGIAFQIFKLAPDATGKILIQKNEPHYSLYRKDEEKILAPLPFEVSKEIRTLADSLFHPKVMSDGSISISIRADGWHQAYRTAPKDTNPMFGQFVQSRFETLYRHTASWVYQLEGLEPHGAETSAKMTDEVLDYVKAKRTFDYVLLFDPEVWNVQMRFLELQWRLHLKNPEERVSSMDLRMGDLKGFWPLAGLATVRSELHPNEPVEIKRYFKNAMEDPFEFLKLTKVKDDYSLRQEMIVVAMENLPPGTVVQIHSHTRVHTLAYRKLGFKVVHQTLNPKYPDAQVDLLESTNDIVVDKIKARLNTRLAVDQAPRGN